MARAAVEQEAKRAGGPAPDIMSFKASPSGDGWDVYVQFVGGYEDGRPFPMPGKFVVVKIGGDWRIIRIAGGA